MSLINDDNMTFLPIIVFVLFAIILLASIVINDSNQYEKLKTDIPNMDCRELVMIHNKYDYWLDGEKDGTIFQRPDLFDLWYDRILELRCVNP